MTTPRETRPAPHRSPTTKDAVRAVIAEQGSAWPVVSFQTVTVIQAVMDDGEVEYRLIWPEDQPQEGNLEILAGAAYTFGAAVGFRCICGGNSPTPQCPDFPDCLPGGGS